MDEARILEFMGEIRTEVRTSNEQRKELFEQVRSLRMSIELIHRKVGEVQVIFNAHTEYEGKRLDELYGKIGAIEAAVDQIQIDQIKEGSAKSNKANVVPVVGGVGGAGVIVWLFGDAGVDGLIRLLKFLKGGG